VDQDEDIRQAVRQRLSEWAGTILHDNELCRRSPEASSVIQSFAGPESDVI
jgi:hypothetical protein